MTVDERKHKVQSRKQKWDGLDEEARVIGVLYTVCSGMPEQAAAVPLTWQNGSEALDLSDPTC